MEYLGIDVHSKYSEVCGISEDGEVTVQRRIAAAATGLKRFFGSRRCSKVRLESGPVTPWVYRQLCELGHEVTVLNPRRLRLTAESTLKKLLIIFALLVTFVFPVSLNAEEGVCDRAEQLKAFDHLLGNWRQKGSSGKMRITKILNGCVIQEIWQLNEFSGTLLRNYDTAGGKWYLTFTAHDLVPQVWEGRFEGGNWVFYRDWELNGKARTSRTFWKKTSARGFAKIVEQLNDDRKTWRLHDRAEFEKDDPPAAIEK